MTISAELLAAVKDPNGGEGLRLTAYQDTKGNWTIGYGHELAAGQDWSGTTWTMQQATDALAEDLNVAQSGAQTLPEWGSLDTPARQDAVTELCFNMGRSTWLGFTTTRGCIEQEDWQGTHDGLLDSDWAEEVGPLRSNRIADQLLNGTYPA